MENMDTWKHIWKICGKYDEPIFGVELGADRLGQAHFSATPLGDMAGPGWAPTGTFWRCLRLPIFWEPRCIPPRIYEIHIEQRRFKLELHSYTIVSPRFQ